MRCFERRGLPKIAQVNNTREKGSLVEAERWTGNKGNVDTVFFGDKMGERDGNLRIIYNNVNGFKVKDFLKSKVIEKHEKRKKTLHGAKKLRKCLEY